MPQGVPFHSPLLYNQQQLQQILANLEKIVFLKFNSQSTTVSLVWDWMRKGSFVEPLSYQDQSNGVHL